MKKRCHFNLVEMLVVIAIIGILAGITFPIIGYVKEKGKRSTCMNNLRQLQVGVSLFRASRKDRYPNWLSNLYNKEMKKNKKVYLCPNDPRDGVRSANRGANMFNYSEMKSTFDAPGTTTVSGTLPSDIDGLHVSYAYEFCGGVWPSSWTDEYEGPNGKITVEPTSTVSWQWVKKEMIRKDKAGRKKYSLETRMPMIRCSWHAEGKGADSMAPFLNVSTTGNSYFSRSKWQDGVDI